SRGSISCKKKRKYGLKARLISLIYLLFRNPFDYIFSMFKTQVKIAFWSGAILVGLIVVLIALIPQFKGKHNQAEILDTPTIIKQIQGLSDLVTVKYVMERIVLLEDVKWYGENRVMLLVHGVVKAGVDLSKIKSDDVKIDGKTVRIALPPAQITDVYIDDKNTQVVERTTGLLRRFDKDLEQNARRQAVEELRSAAKYGGILNDAERQARAQLSIFLGKSGISTQFK
ncbi:MAG: DUF4230 domain-containing protein, partial [Verrucomicrobiae bacterium]|nr:DUF4230 domain-containing protein [Verrucomicrobiae bacterium]